MSASARPGSSSGSSSSCWPNRASTQAWNRVPKRAAGDGGRGIGRARSAAKPVGVVAQPRQRGRRQARRQRHAIVRRPVAAWPPSSSRVELVVPLLDRASSSSMSSIVVGSRRPAGVPAAHRRRRRRAGARPRRCGATIGHGLVRVAGRRGVDVVLGGLRRATARARRPRPAIASRIVRRGTATGRAPPLSWAAQHQRRDRAAVPGPGQRDVAEPQLLDAPRAPWRARRSASRSSGVWPAERGQVAGVAAQRARQHRRARSASWTGRGWSGTSRSVTPTRNTTSHSRPLARWTVSSLTESASVGVATSRPWPYSSSASSQASRAGEGHLRRRRPGTPPPP